MHHDRIHDLSRARLRIASILTGGVVALYFGFVLLIAFQRDLLGRMLAPGLSVGIVAGVAVIVGSWLLTWVYVRWANRHLDAGVRGLSREDDR